MQSKQTLWNKLYTLRHHRQWVSRKENFMFTNLFVKSEVNCDSFPWWMAFPWFLLSNFILSKCECFLLSYFFELILHFYHSPFTLSSILGLAIRNQLGSSLFSAFCLCLKIQSLLSFLTLHPGLPHSRESALWWKYQPKWTLPYCSGHVVSSQQQKALNTRWCYLHTELYSLKGTSIMEWVSCLRSLGLLRSGSLL